VAGTTADKRGPVRGALAAASGRMRHWWDKKLTRNDGVAAFTLGLGLDWVLVLRSPKWSTSFVTSHLSGLFTTGVAVTGVLLGLTLTSLAIIADYLRSDQSPSSAQQPDTSADEHVRLPPELADGLIGAYIGTTRYLGLATVIGLVGLVPTGITELKVTLAAWTVSTVLAIVGVARSISLLRVVVRAIVHGNK
jgi:hypothetical protein